jgi:hypothetical protein
MPTASRAGTSTTTATRGFGQGETILVVEDDPEVRQVAVATLETLGFHVREAETGDEAAAMLKDGGGYASCSAISECPATSTESTLLGWCAGSGRRSM